MCWVIYMLDQHCGTLFVMRFHSGHVTRDEISIGKKLHVKTFHSFEVIITHCSVFKPARYVLLLHPKHITQHAGFHFGRVKG